VPRCVFVIFGGSQRQAEGGILRRARNPVQSIGHRADEILHAIARGGGDGVKFQAALFAEIAQRFEARAIGGGIKLGGNHDHGLLGERFAEGGKLAIDDFKGVDWVLVVRIARINQMNKEARALNVAEEANTEAGAFMCAFNEAGEIGHDKSAAKLGAVPASAAVGIDDAEVGLERGERIVGNFRACSRDHRDQSGFSGVRKTDQADIREKFQFEAKMALFPRKPILVLARGLMPGLCEMLVAASAASSMNDQDALPRGGEISDGFSGLIVKGQRAHGDF